MNTDLLEENRAVGTPLKNLAGCTSTVHNMPVNGGQEKPLFVPFFIAGAEHFHV